MSDPSSSPSMLSTTIAESDSPERDPKYYFQDGSIIILVQSTLFKIHRSRLLQDSSVFGATFSLPSPDRKAATANLEGDSDENPFVLHGETTQRFRALLFALYAMPYEIENIVSDLDLLVNAASASHKYGFEGIEKWAANLLKKKIQTEDFSEGAAALLPLFEYAVLSDSTDISNDLLRIILQDETSVVRTIIRADGEEHEYWKKLYAIALYRYTIKGPVRWKSEPHHALLPVRIRIILHVASSTLAHLPHAISWTHTCDGEEKCTSGLASMLKACTEGYDGGHQPADFIGWYRYIRPRFKKSYYPKSTRCQDLGVAECANKAVKFEAGWWDFFADLKW
ncbi:hypothetical protein BOTBODRAFT_171571 [Botryobasidium botryosum FD-172 SS1]|uniref:BTB domain-containing protein n=1 Tax=Botryobasidium botryosum (strain FD-172 SS1) TaxID=930990 RepID=A0A067MQN0_BOTB1|nr:hypothetical protein BOTBODRAFT_171571 [Botryobasidium botryosum FD-172 SS1]